MNYLVEQGKKLNIKKVIGAIVVILLILIILVRNGQRIAEKNFNEKCVEELQQQVSKIEEEKRVKEEEERRRKEEEERKQAERRIELTSNEWNEEQKNNILHIYNDTGEKRVFLTFDDGPSTLITPLILDVLKQEEVKATFFLLGNNVKNNPDLVKREYNEGHYVANHGYSHKYSAVYSSPQATLDEYNYTEQAIKDALENQNYRSNLFRFPGGSNGGFYNSIKQEAKALLRENGIVHLDWNSLSEDAAGTYTKEQLLQNVKDTMGDKQSVVILMHDSSDKILTYEMLTDLIHYLKEQGYVFKSIYDII